ncbi:MAG: RdgB/HAM1 family non-canonical purine NTP pyrophosphatase [Sulfolobales archaeon]
MSRIKILHATNNINKIRETELLLRRFYPHLDFVIERLPEDIEVIEIQDERLENIALYSLRDLLNKLRDSDRWDLIIREDSGLFIEALKGFPGPFSSYVYRTIGVEGVMKLLEGSDNRRAYFKAVIAYRIKRESIIRIASGVVYGEISREIRGHRGFGFDPIFIPEGFKETFAELGEEVKIRVSHRSKALREMINTYINLVLR